MAKSGIYIANMSEVIGDFRSYDKNTQKAFRKTMSKAATEVRRTQRRVLRLRVKEWTGTLAKSIMKVLTSKGSRNNITWEIGPAVDTPYYRFIEEGGQPYGNPSAKRFRGYWYVRNSVKPIRVRLRYNLSKDIKNATRK